MKLAERVLKMFENGSVNESGYASKQQVDAVLPKINAFNNVKVSKREGQSLVVVTIAGTRFALDGVKDLLTKEAIAHTEMKTPSKPIQIAYEK